MSEEAPREVGDIPLGREGDENPQGADPDPRDTNPERQGPEDPGPSDAPDGHRAGSLGPATGVDSRRFGPGAEPAAELAG